MAHDTPPRRWFSFRLRTLFVVVTVVCVGLGYQLNWIHQRRAALQDERLVISHLDDGPFPVAPGGLWMLGEKGVVAIGIKRDQANVRYELSKEEKARIVRLFPEAMIFWSDGE